MRGSFLSLIVAGENLVDAVVYLKDIKKGKKSELAKVTMNPKGCEYMPHVSAFPVDTSVELLNRDVILYNERTLSKANAPMNLAQPKFKEP